jgi:hypothetical protein
VADDFDSWLTSQLPNISGAGGSGGGAAVAPPADDFDSWLSSQLPALSQPAPAAGPAYDFGTPPNEALRMPQTSTNSVAGYREAYPAAAAPMAPPQALGLATATPGGNFGPGLTDFSLSPSPNVYTSNVGSQFSPPVAAPPDWDRSTKMLDESVAKFGSDLSKWPVGEPDRALGAINDLVQSQGDEPKPVSKWVVDYAPKLLLGQKPTKEVSAADGWRKLSPRKAAEIGILPGKPDQYSDDVEKGGWFPLGKYAAQTENDEARKSLADTRYPGLQGNAAGRVLAAGLESARQAISPLARPFLAVEEFFNSDAPKGVADEMVRNKQAFDQRLAEKAGGEVERTFQGVAGSLGQMGAGVAVAAATGGGAAAPYIIAGSIGATAANDAITEGRDLGLQGEQLALFAAGRGLAETLPSLLLTKLGMPGAEGLLSKVGGGAVTAATKKEFAGKLAMRLIESVGVPGLQEIPDEYLTAIMNRGLNAVAGIENKKWVDEAVETAVQAFLVGAVANAPRGGLDAAKAIRDFRSGAATAPPQPQSQPPGNQPPPVPPPGPTNTTPPTPPVTPPTTPPSTQPPTPAPVASTLPWPSTSESANTWAGANPEAAKFLIDKLGTGEPISRQDFKALNEKLPDDQKLPVKASREERQAFARRLKGGVQAPPAASVPAAPVAEPTAAEPIPPQPAAPFTPEATAKAIESLGNIRFNRDGEEIDAQVVRYTEGTPENPLGDPIARWQNEAGGFSEAIVKRENIISIGGPLDTEAKAPDAAPPKETPVPKTEPPAVAGPVETPKVEKPADAPLAKDDLVIWTDRKGNKRYGTVKAVRPNGTLAINNEKNENYENGGWIEVGADKVKRHDEAPQVAIGDTVETQYRGKGIDGLGKVVGFNPDGTIEVVGGSGRGFPVKPWDAKIHKKAEPAAKTYEDAQRAIDEYEGLLEKKYGPSAFDAPIDEPRGGFKDVKVKHPLSDDELQQLRSLYKRRDELDQRDAESLHTAVEEKFKPLIGDETERREFVKKLTKVDNQLARYLDEIHRKEGGSDTDARHVAEVANEILKHIDRKANGNEQAAFVIDVQKIADGNRLRLTAEPGLGPLDSSIVEAQRWLDHLYGDSAPKLPVVRAPAPSPTYPPRIAGVKVKPPVDAQVHNNISYELYPASAEGDGRAVVRVLDQDSGKAVSFTVYPDMEKARAAYDDAVRIAKKEDAEPVATEPEAPKVEPAAAAPAEPAASTPAATDYGTKDAPNRVTIGEHFGKQLSEGGKFGTIADARKEAGRLLGAPVMPGTSLAKAVDESVELGVVIAARKIIADGANDKEVFDKLLDLYDRQPNLAVRTSTSMSQQAYSTPAPLAFVAKILADVGPKDVVFDSSAGNGMLLAGVPTQNAVANELNPDRAGSIKSQGIRTFNEDATDFQLSQNVYPADRVIINPPFGTIKDAKGDNQQWSADGVTTDQVDHAIVLNTLADMKPNGKAVLIIGAKGAEYIRPASGGGGLAGPQKDRQRAMSYSGNPKAFFDALYDRYKVTDHFTVSGDLYKKQGAGFPVDVIVIDGKMKAGAESRPRPWNFKNGGLPRVYRSWEELKRDFIERPVAGQAETGSGTDGVEPGTVGAGGASDANRPADDVATVSRPSGGAAAVDAGPDGRGSGAGVSGGVGTADGADARPAKPKQPRREPGVSPSPVGSGSGAVDVPDGSGPDALAGSGRSGAVDERPADVPSEPPAGDERINPDDLSEEQLEEFTLWKMGLGPKPSFLAPKKKPQPREPKKQAEPVARDPRYAYEDMQADLFRETMQGPPPPPPPKAPKPPSPPKPPRKDESTADKAAAAKKEFADAAKALADYMKGRTFSTVGGVDPEAARLAVKLVAKGVKAGYYTFQEFVEKFAEMFGKDLVAKLSLPLEQAWGVIHAADRSGKMSPVGSVAEVLAVKTETPVAQPEGSSYQVPYEPRSGQTAMGTLLPRTHVDAVRRSLDKVEAKYGNIDEFVARELGFDPKTLGDRLAGEQVDAVALAIANHKNGEGFIIGDQTGIGKGRAAAAMIRYAEQQGLVPVFVTETPNLYGDMYRDLMDIGIHKPGGAEGETFEALFTNGLKGNDVVEIRDNGGEVVKRLEQTGDLAQRLATEAVSNFLSGEGLVANAPQAVEGKKRKQNQKTKFNAIFTTYSQLQELGNGPTWRNYLIRDISPRAFFILDESHNAGGEDEEKKRKVKPKPGKTVPVPRAEFVRQAIQNAPGVYYSSATFAKRPEVMSLYARAGLGKAVDSPKKLGSAIAAGGVPLQQVVSEMLAEAGQYLRRERSYQGVEFKPQTVSVDLGIADKSSEIFRAIQRFDLLKKPAVDNLTDTVVGDGGKMGDDSSTGGKGVDSLNFTSLLHNIVDSALVALKADAAADMAIASWKAGETPVIAIDNTMESALDYYLESNPAVAGAQVNFDFSATFDRYLERTREVIIKQDRKDPNSWTRHRLTDEELGPLALAAYEEAKNFIRNFKEQIPASPIDWVRYRLKAAGVKVAEVTGRQKMIEYSGDMNSGRLAPRPTEEAGVGGKTRSVAAINAGKLDALIINRSGSTGLSIHASSKFKNQRKRHMIIMQPAKNIDVFMQTLGRIHRTGQTVLPAYTLLMSDAPAESRPAAILSKKLASLNANVTGAAKGDVGFEVPDIMNQVGDLAVTEYLMERPELNIEITSPLVAGGAVQEWGQIGIARKATGRVSLLPVARQQQFWSEVVSAYDQKIEELDRLGANPLVARTLPLEAKTLSQVKVFDGVEGSDNPFEQPAYMTKASVKKLGKPFSSQEVRDKLLEETGASDINANDFFRKAKAWAGKRGEELADNARAFLKKKIDEAPEEKRSEIRERANGQSRTVMEAFEKYPIGTTVKVKAWFGELNGVVTNISQKHKVDNPIMPSSWVVTIAVSDAVRTVNIPITQLNSPNNGIEASGESLESAIQEFDNSASQSREERYIATGNLLAGWSKANAKHAQVIFYTDDEGKVNRGLLMPQNFDADAWRENAPVPFTDAAAAHKFMSRGGLLWTPDSALWVVTDSSGGLVVQAAKARQKSGKYTLNRDILAAASPNEFVSKSDKMEMKVPRQSAREVLEAIMRVAPLQAIEQRDMAREVLGLPPIKKKGLRDGGPGDGAMGAPRSLPPHGNLALQAGRASRWTDRVRVAKKFAKAVEAFGRAVPVRNHFVRRSFGGLFKPFHEVIRLATAYDLPVLAHEVGHALEKMVFGLPRGPGWTTNIVTTAMQRELVAMGRALYRNRVPHAGYRREGFAEFIRLWITEPSTAQTLATKFHQWFVDHFLTRSEAGARALEDAIEEYRSYSDMGSVNRAKAGIARSGTLKKLGEYLKVAREALSVGGIWEELEPLYQASEMAKERSGQELAPSKDPYKISVAYRSTASAIVKQMVEDGMMDAARNPTPIAPLSDISKLVTPAEREDFKAYLWAKRAKALIEDKKKGPRNPGMSLADANQIISELETPQFANAAAIVYRWNDGILDYASQLSPTLAAAVQKIRASDPGFYIPLQRQFEDGETVRQSSGNANAERGTVGQRLMGSGRGIKDPIDVMISQAETVISAAHDRAALDALFDLQKIEGMGVMVEEVPPEMVPTDSRDLSDMVAKVAKKLRDQGVDLYDQNGDPIDPDDFLGQMMTLFAPAKQYKGSEPIISVWDADAGRFRWYYVNKDIYNSIRSAEAYVPPSDAARLLDSLLLAPIRYTTFAARAGFTGFNAPFSLVMNTIRDVGRTLAYNTSATRNPLEALVQGLAMLPQAAVRALSGNRLSNRVLEVYDRLGVKMAQSLYQDRPGARRLGNKIFEGRVRRMMNPGDWLDYYSDLLQFSDTAARAAEMKMVAKNKGIDLDQRLTLDDAISLAIAAKEVTTDFSATGRVSRLLSPYTPFLRSGLQGPRAAVRAAKRDPVGYLLKGLSTAAISAMLWWTYKDEEWWKKMSALDRMKNDYIPVEVNGKMELLQVPRNQDADYVFGAGVQAALDWWYTEDPASVTEWMTEFVSAMNPINMPPLVDEAIDQLRNKDSYTGAPVVPEAYANRRPSQQHNEYTSEFAKWLGDLTESDNPGDRASGLSPMRIDHAIRGLSGGVGSFAADMLGFAVTGKTPTDGREAEMADTPIVGRLFRRGGPLGNRPKSVDKMYKLLSGADEGKAAPERDETKQESNLRLVLDDASQAVAAISKIRQSESSVNERRRLVGLSASIAEEAVRRYEAGDSSRAVMAATRRAYEYLAAKATGNRKSAAEKMGSLLDEAGRNDPTASAALSIIFKYGKERNE